MEAVYNILSGLLSPADWHIAQDYTHGRLLQPDLILAPDGRPYLFRWHLVPRNTIGNVYFHIQVASDPERPLHDHPWDNTSVILVGGYDEMYHPRPRLGAPPLGRKLRKGDSVWRPAETAHRLILPKTIPYTMTLFTTGAKRREWGFWYEDGWHSSARHVADREGVSIHTEDQDASRVC
jgi:hypothetical protein